MARTSVSQMYPSEKYRNVASPVNVLTLSSMYHIRMQQNNSLPVCSLQHTSQLLLGVMYLPRQYLLLSAGLWSLVDTLPSDQSVAS